MLFFVVKLKSSWYTCDVGTMYKETDLKKMLFSALLALLWISWQTFFGVIVAGSRWYSV